MDENQDMNERLRRVEEWMEQRIAQQITFPFDVQSQKILNRYFLAKVGNLDFTSFSGNIFPNIIIEQNGHQYVLSVQENLILFTVDTGANTLLLGQNITTGQQGTFDNGDQVILSTTDDLPAPLVDGAPYYVVDSTNGGKTIKLATPDGNYTLTGPLLSGAVNATLSSVWAGTSGARVFFFSNGDYRDGSVTNGSASITWSLSLSSGATAGVTVYQPQDITTNGTGQQYIQFFT